jgi:predicted class III extradiol MEMO1 family dioxygenase
MPPYLPLSQMVAHSASQFKIAFNCYDQSSKATSSSDSSVSYAAAVMTPL